MTDPPDAWRKESRDSIIVARGSIVAHINCGFWVEPQKGKKKDHT
jgi:hypothetical protein